MKRKDFQTILNGKKTDLFVLENNNGMQVYITNFGGKVVAVLLPDKNGQATDVVLGYDNIHDYIYGNPFFGAVVGRYANRINNGEFTLDGKTYHLHKNHGKVHLHGGDKGFHQVVWDAEPVTSGKEPTLILNYRSPDGEEQYPGNLNVTTVYRLTDQNELNVEFRAETDAPTIINLTTHSFFNLAGAGSETILNHEVTIYADRFTPLNTEMVPTGELRKVENTPFDFRTAKPIGKDISAPDEQLKAGHGYDHNFVLNKDTGDLSLAATALDPASGRKLEVWTDQPGLQFYTGNFLDGSDVGKEGKIYRQRSAFCFETQHFPDSPHHSHFPSVVLRPGDSFSHNSIFKFYF